MEQSGRPFLIIKQSRVQSKPQLILIWGIPVYIEPGSPWQNGYIESFHSRFRDECLSREMLLNLREARVVIEDWRQHYNTERPHSRLGYLSTEEFIKTKILTH